MTRDEGATASLGPNNWFEYAYLTSEATLEADGMTKEAANKPSSSRLRAY